ncbi:hypothetical protein LV457_14710 [Mycobacterium sp. MYCO198283]|uniref:hypothetical protein n=1 Tax=Mycobacterium sp. MYCO198283 TaxID=2883505 RepID=UPI001E35B1F6|nr:hypothetical protein [Mycobacterium sp. MYCO198283]MCG5433529.1 hypothetical protein [Mycobacterium sp. MYCO198283]
MTTVEQLRSHVTRLTCDVTVAGVPWPAYKVMALVVGFVVAAIVGVVAGTAATAVLTGTAAAVVTGAGLHLYCASRR